MRKLTMLFALAMTILVPAAATDSSAGVFGMARYLPADLDAFAAVRIDDGHWDILDGLLTRVEALAADVSGRPQEFPAARDLAADLLNASREDLDLALQYAGDFAALGSIADTASVFWAFSMTDRAAVEAIFLERNPTGITAHGAIGRYTVYTEDGDGVAFLFSDDVVLVFPLREFDPSRIAGEDYPRLNDDPAFAGAVGALPADAYNFGIYAAPSAFADTPARQFFTAPVAIGGTLLEGTTLAIDTAVYQSADGMSPVAIDPAFQRFVPGESGALVHAANLRGLVDGLTSLSQAMGGDDVRQNLEDALNGAELTLDDLYAWAGGDFAVFARADFASLLPSLMAETPDFSQFGSAFDFGVAIEVTDPAAARAFSDRLRIVLHEKLGGAEGVTVADEEIGGVNVTTVTASVPLDQFEYPLTIGIGLSDEVFAVGTYGAIQAVFNGAAGLDQSAALQDSARYWLPGATSLWYLDGRLIANFMLLNGLILFGRDGMNEAAGTTADDMQRAVNAIASFLRHATITSAIAADGTMLLRATVSLSEQ